MPANAMTARGSMVEGGWSESLGRQGGGPMSVWKWALISVVLLGGSPSLGLEVQEHDGVKYVTGGVGFDERKELNALSKQFNLKLTLALANGEYLGDSKVHITTADGATALDAV